MLKYLNNILFPKGWVYISLLLLYSASVFAKDSQQAFTLQLKWEHEFQFAGYYAAKWQGYYKDAGLDITILPASTPSGKIVNPQEELLHHRADFAIGGVDILIAASQGKPLAILAPIFQHSPSAIFSLKNIPLKTPQDLLHLRIASAINDLTYKEFEALLQLHGLNDKSITLVDAPPTVQTLVDDKADAIVTYEISALTQAKEKSITLNMLYPRDFGILFYGDTLYTHKEMIKKHPDVVNKFVEASIKGWKYALDHKQEMAKNISQLPRYIIQYEDFYQYNLDFAHIIENYLLYPYNPIGQNNISRWQHIYALLSSIHVTQNNFDIHTLFQYEDTSQKSFSEYYLWMIAILIITTIFFALYYLFKKKKLWLPLFILLSCLLAVELFIEYNYQRKQDNLAYLHALEKLFTIKARLEAELNTILTLTHGVAAFISLNPQLSQQAFNKYAQYILKQAPLLQHLEAAPDFILRYIYPLEGNKMLKGLNYRTHPQQHQSILSLQYFRQTIIDGPLTPVQDEQAFIAHAPVYYQKDNTEHFWGIVSAPFSTTALFSKVGLFNSDLGVEIAIRHTNNIYQSEDTFFGNERIFHKDHSIIKTLQVGNSYWQIAVHPLPSTATNHTSFLWLLRLTTGIIAILFSLTIYSRHKHLLTQQHYISRLHRNKALLQKVAHLTKTGTWELNEERIVIFWPKQIELITHTKIIPNQQYINNFYSILPMDQKKILEQHIDYLYTIKTDFDIEIFFFPHIDKRWLRILASPIVEEGELKGLIGAIQDITEHKNTQKTLEYQASYDTLTRLPNRRLFIDQLTHEISHHQRNHTKFAVLFVDLDNFKPVNDTLGHQAGDTILRIVAQRIQNNIRQSDIVARISGDEFIVLLSNLHTPSFISIIAEKLLTNLSDPYPLEKQQVFITASIGISIYPDDTEDIEQLIQYADQAMYIAKQSGKNHWYFFTKKMQQESEHAHDLHNKLQLAVQEKSLSIYYQPIIDLHNHRIVKCESLLRWNHPKLGFISPVEFIPIAEKSTLINQIDQFVLEHSIKDMTEINTQLQQKIGISINISPRFFMPQKHTDESVKKWFQQIEQGINDLPITVEITERLLIVEEKQALQALNKLQFNQIQVALDDFGTGYSSLSYLKKFPVNCLKIDRTFIRDIEYNEDSKTLVETILLLAQKLNLEVIAEGVETQEQINLLRNFEQPIYIQGYYYSPALSKQDFIKFCQNFSSFDPKNSIT